MPVEKQRKNLKSKTKERQNRPFKKHPPATYLAAQNTLFMVKHMLPLGAFYDFGNKVGYVITALFFLLMVLALIFVMAKYLFGKDKRDNANAA